MFYINVKKISNSYKRFDSPDLRQLACSLNFAVKQRISTTTCIHYTRLNFQICQFLLRRGFFLSVKLYKANKTDYLDGAIRVQLRLFGNKKPFTHVSIQEFFYPQKPWRRRLFENVVESFAWWKLKPYRNAKLVIVKTAFGLMTAHECVYYRIGGRVLLIIF